MRGFSSKNSLKTQSKSFSKIPKVCKNTNTLYSVAKCPVAITFFLYVRVMTSLGSNVRISQDCSFRLASLSKLTSVGPVFQGQGTALPSRRGPSWPLRNLESVRTSCYPLDCSIPLSMGFSRQEYWSGLPFPSPGNLPSPGLLYLLRRILYLLSHQGSPKTRPHCISQESSLGLLHGRREFYH